MLSKILEIKGRKTFPIVQQGMGAGISLMNLAAAVAKEDCVGTISSVALNYLTARRLKKNKMSLYEATVKEVKDAKTAANGKGAIAMNIMCALFRDYKTSVEASIDGGIDMIVSGAGFPTRDRVLGDNHNLPKIVKEKYGKNHNIALIPIVSNSAGLNYILKKWKQEKYLPDAIIVEGPKAGGHLGFNYKKIKAAGDKFLEKYDLFKELLPPVLDLVNEKKNYKNNLPIPVIVAGGIYTHKDIIYALNQGASGVGIGSRYAATYESTAPSEFKQAIIDSTKQDIVIADKLWGSPCGFPFRYIKKSPLADKKSGNSFCICSGLLAAADFYFPKKESIPCPEGYVIPPGKECPGKNNVKYQAIYTIGTNGHRIDKILGVKELTDELKGK